MGYIHKGVVSTNGKIDPEAILTESEELTVHPEDDGIQITDYEKGDFEWWYFDISDVPSGCFLKLVIHIGTDPLRTKVKSQLAISLNTSEINKGISYPFSLNDMRADVQQCNISISNKIKILVEPDNPFVYTININIPGFKCDLRFKSYLEGWKPLGKKVLYESGKRKVDFSWVIPVPGATVEGYFYNENRKHTFTGARGYHDHNYIKIDRKYPLYLDNLVNKWYWGKCYAGGYTVVFCDVYCMINRILSLMVADQNKIIYSSNNLINSSVLSYGYDRILKAEYPVSLQIKCLDEQFPFKAEFEFEKILDRMDLLEGVNRIFKFLIKQLVARPVYHGIFASVRLDINNSSLDGYGNFESMVFRGK